MHLIFCLEIRRHDAVLHAFKLCHEQVFVQNLGVSPVIVEVLFCTLLLTVEVQVIIIRQHYCSATALRVKAGLVRF